mgnify:CR=1 FL=1
MITIIDILNVLDSNFFTLEGGHIYHHDYSLMETVKFFITNARKLNVPYLFSLLSRCSLFRFQPRELFCSQSSRSCVNVIFFLWQREKSSFFCLVMKSFVRYV